MGSRGRPVRHQAAVVLIALLAGWVVTLLIAPLLGAAHLKLADVFAGVPTARLIFWHLRMPRVLLAALAGGALAISGLVFQTLFHNPLAEPYTLGVASGAALGAVLAIHLGAAGLAGSLPWVGVASFAGALTASLVVVLLAYAGERKRWGGGGGLDTASLLLAGVAVALTCSALILFVQYVSDFHQTFTMLRWMMGALSVVGFGEVLWLAPWVLGGFVLLLFMRWDLNLLLAGEEMAAGRGLDVRRLRWMLLFSVSLMVGALVAVVGPIGFVGLIVPHWVRRILPADHLVLLPACFLVGGAFLVLSDIAARTLLAPAEIPVGILTALLGGPFFLWVLARRR